MKVSKVIDAITNAEFSEDDLGRLISSAIEQRNAMRKAKAIKLARSLEVGDKVQVITGIKPQYMIGHTGVVVENEGTPAKHGYIWIHFGRKIYGRSRTWGPRIMMPASTLKKVS